MKTAERATPQEPASAGSVGTLGDRTAPAGPGLLIRSLAPIRRRVLARMFLRWYWVTALAIDVAVVVTLLIVKLYLSLAQYAVIALALVVTPVLIAAARCLAVRLPLQRLAQMIDQKAGLQERVASAVDGALRAREGRAGSSRMLALLEHDALGALRALDAARLLPFKREAVCAALALAATLALCLIRASGLSVVSLPIGALASGQSGDSGSGQPVVVPSRGRGSNPIPARSRAAPASIDRPSAVSQPRQADNAIPHQGGEAAQAAANRESHQPLPGNPAQQSAGAPKKLDQNALAGNASHAAGSTAPQRPQSRQNQPAEADHHGSQPASGQKPQLAATGQSGRQAAYGAAPPPQARKSAGQKGSDGKPQAAHPGGQSGGNHQASREPVRSGAQPQPRRQGGSSSSHGNPSQAGQPPDGRSNPGSRGAKTGQPASGQAPGQNNRPQSRHAAPPVSSKRQGSSGGSSDGRSQAGPPHVGQPFTTGGHGKPLPVRPRTPAPVASHSSFSFRLPKPAPGAGMTPLDGPRGGKLASPHVASGNPQSKVPFGNGQAQVGGATQEAPQVSDIEQNTRIPAAYRNLVKQYFASAAPAQSGQEHAR